jgi:hypothetical protein
VESDLIDAGMSDSSGNTRLFTDLIDRGWPLWLRVSRHTTAWSYRQAIALHALTALHESKPHVETDDSFRFQILVSSQYCHLPYLT